MFGRHRRFLIFEARHLHGVLAALAVLANSYVDCTSHVYAWIIQIPMGSKANYWNKFELCRKPRFEKVRLGMNRNGEGS